MERRPIELTPAQEMLVHLPTEGQFLVRGAAGSGKTAVALARALHLARQPLLHGAPRVLLLARAPALAAELRARRDDKTPPAIARRLDPPAMNRRLDIDTLTTWARGFLARDGAPLELLDRASTMALVDAAMALVRRRSRSRLLRRPLSFFASEIESMLLGLGVETFDDYQPVAREGRGTSLDDEARRCVFAVYREFRALAHRIGRTPPLALATEALARLTPGRSPPYDHVVVDDAHRLAPIELKLARALAAGGSLTLFTSLEQRFDPLAASLRDLGLGRLDRTETLPIVKRGPAPIFAAALALLRGRGGENGVRSIQPGGKEGAKPRLLLCEGWEQELDLLVATIGAMERPRREIAVITSGDAALELVAASLARAGIAARRVRDDEPDVGGNGRAPPLEANADAVALCPLECAAGREFPVVVVFDVDRGTWPRDPRALAEHERAGADDADRRALHLAMTRATEELILLATHKSCSPLLPKKRLAIESFGSSGSAKLAAVTRAGA